MEKKMKKYIVPVLLVGCLNACSPSIPPEPNDFYDLPVIGNSKLIEKEVGDHSPIYMMRYVASESKSEVIEFYKKQYKEPLSIKEYGDTTVLSYKNGDKNIKVQLESAPDGTDIYLMLEK